MKQTAFFVLATTAILTLTTHASQPDENGQELNHPIRKETRCNLFNTEPSVDGVTSEDFPDLEYPGRALPQVIPITYPAALPVPVQPDDALHQIPRPVFVVVARPAPEDLTIQQAKRQKTQHTQIHTALDENLEQEDLTDTEPYDTDEENIERS